MTGDVEIWREVGPVLNFAKFAKLEQFVLEVPGAGTTVKFVQSIQSLFDGVTRPGLVCVRIGTSW
jgi:hypothetical protein